MSQIFKRRFSSKGLIVTFSSFTQLNIFKYWIPVLYRLKISFQYKLGFILFINLIGYRIFFLIPNILFLTHSSWYAPRKFLCKQVFNTVVYTILLKLRFFLPLKKAYFHPCWIWDQEEITEHWFITDNFYSGGLLRLPASYLVSQALNLRLLPTTLLLVWLPKTLA